MLNLYRLKGYSLYELLMTLALAALVMTIGVPSFGQLVADKRLRTEVDALFHAIHRARSESIARRRVVSICPSRDGRYCEPGKDWSSGWILFINKGRQDTGVRDDNEVILHYHQTDGRSRIMANRQNFSLRGTLFRATNGTIVFCDLAARAESRALVISYTGRPRVTRTTRHGKPYECSD